MQCSAFSQDSPNNFDDLVNLYNIKLNVILDRHTPLVTKMIKVNDNISDAKRERRRTERRNLSDLAIFKAKKDYQVKL